jgi:mannosyl-oligosaccharide glucosidase
MDQDGWIAREQILGNEARSRVPIEFLAQHKSNGNPPTFFLTVKKLLNIAESLKAKSTAEHQAGDSHIVIDSTTDDNLSAISTFLHDAYPLLARYFDWYLKTQAGVAPNTFRWQGRTENHTFTSGML